MALPWTVANWVSKRTTWSRRRSAWKREPRHAHGQRQRLDGGTHPGPDPWDRGLVAGDRHLAGGAGDRDATAARQRPRGRNRRPADLVGGADRDRDPSRSGRGCRLRHRRRRRAQPRDPRAAHQLTRRSTFSGGSTRSRPSSESLMSPISPHAKLNSSCENGFRRHPSRRSPRRHVRTWR